MAYTPTDWVDDVTPVDAARMDHIETGIVDAHAALETKGVPNGYAALDATGKVPAAQLPPPPQGVPSGCGMMWFGSAAPSGWLLCDGSTITNAQTLYPSLWKNIDPTWKSGANVVLPDLRGRIPVGRGTNADVGTLGQNDGVAVASRTARHRHTVTDSGHVHGVTDPTHAHTMPTMHAGSSGGIGENNGVGGNVAGTYAAATGISIVSATTGVTVGLAGAALDAPPYLVVNYIIKT